MVGVVFGMPSGFHSLGGGSPASSTSTSSNFQSKTPKADEALGLLVKNEELLRTMAGASLPNFPPSKGMLVEVLWGLLNPEGNSYLTQSDIEVAVRDAGGDAGMSTELWEQMNPDRKSSITPVDYADLLYLGVVLGEMLPTVRADVEELRQNDAMEKARNSSNSVLDMTEPFDSNYINMFV